MQVLLVNILMRLRVMALEPLMEVVQLPVTERVVVLRGGMQVNNVLHVFRECPDHLVSILMQLRVVVKV